MIDRRLIIRALSLALVMAALVPSISLAQTAVEGMPALNVTTGADGETQYSLSLQILALMTALTILPSFLLGLPSSSDIGFNVIIYPVPGGKILLGRSEP